MAKVFVVYDTKYGNTKLAAEEIVKGIKEVKGIEVALHDIKEVDAEDATNSDAILIGSPNHVGRPARGISGFIDGLGKVALATKWYAVFSTHMAKDDRAAKKMEQNVAKRAPGLKSLAPALLVRVEGMKGPIAESELVKCKNFGKEVAVQLEKA